MKNNNNYPINKLPTTTMHQSRLQIFQPTRRPVHTTQFIETQWGTARVHGRIGQGHADVLEAIFSQAAAHHVCENGDIKLLVDLYKVRTAAGGEKLSGAQLDKIITELMAVVIDMDIPALNLRCKGHIINDAEESQVNATTRQGAIGKNRKMWRVDIPANFVKLMQEDLKLFYDPAPIAKLTTGIAQAIARYIATHRDEPQGGWKVDGLIKVVGGGKSMQALKDRRKDLKIDAANLIELGLVVCEGRITRSKKED